MTSLYIGNDSDPEDFRFYNLFPTDNGWRDEITLTTAEADDFNRVRREWLAWQHRLIAARQAAEDKVDAEVERILNEKRNANG